MKNIKLKIIHIFIPYLIVSIATIFIYNLVRWYLEINLGIDFLKEDILDFWIPFGLPWIPILLFMRRKVQLLKVKGKNNNGYFYYYFAMASAIAIPLIISQVYMEKNSFKIIEVASIDQIRKLENERFFKVKSFDVVPNLSQSYVSTRTTGKYNKSLNFYIFFATPFKGVQSVWYGVKYKDQISNYKSKEKKMAFYNNFAAKTENDFPHYNYNNVTYFKKLVNSFEKDGFIGAIKMKQIDKDEEPIILVPLTDDFDKNSNQMFFWTYISFIIGLLLILLAILIPKLNETN